MTNIGKLHVIFFVIFASNGDMYLLAEYKLRNSKKYLARNKHNWKKNIIKNLKNSW